MLKALWKRVGPWLPWIAVIGLLVLLVEAVHPSALLAALHHADLWLLLGVMACGLGGLVLRGIRWHLLLKAIACPNTLLDSIILFTAAQAAMLVPAGQFLLPVLQRSQHGTLVRRSAPTILIQEFIFGLLVLPAALPGVGPYHFAGWLLLVALIFNAGTIAFLWHGRTLHWGLRLLHRIPLPFLHEHIHNMGELQEHFVTVARGRSVLWGSIFDMGAIGLAGFGLYLSLRAVGVTYVPWVDSLAIYALGSSVGTLSALPAGIGANEDISTLVLARMGVAAGPAAAATLLFRAVNLLTGTAVGWAVLLLFSARFKIHPSMKGVIEAIHRAEKKTLDEEDRSESPDHALKK